MKNLKFLFLLISLNAFSQNVELKWAEKIKTKDNAVILGGKNGNYYTRHRDNDKNLICRKYDKNLNLLDEKQVNFNLSEKKYFYLDAYFLNDKIVHIISENIRKEDKKILVAGVTDLNLKTVDQTYILDEADEDAASFGKVSVSPDSTKIAVYNEIVGKRREPSTLNFKVYDSGLKNVLLNKSAQLPIKAKNFTTETVTVDNFGNVYVLAKITKEKDEKEKNQSLFYYKLVVFNNEDKPKEFDFEYPNKDIESIDVISGEDNTIICTGFLKSLNKGFLSNTKKTLISDELFSAIIDCKTQSLKSSNKYELEGLYPEKPKKGQDYVPYKVRNIFQGQNGGSVVVAEQYKLVVVQHYSQNGGGGTSYYYYYCDIACIHINSKSEVESVSKMPKYQMNAANPSIVSTQFEGTTYIVYEDLEKNANAENDKETKRSTNSMFSSSSKNALFLLSINPTGEMKKEIIYSYKDSKIRPVILRSVIAAKNEIILNANDQIGVLKIAKK